MRADGHGVRKIVGALNADKIPSPKAGRGWSISCVHNMLKNETYRGTITTGQRRFKKGEGLKGWHPRKDWVITRNAHEAIIGEKVWDAVRSKDSTTTLSHPTTIKTRTKHLLTGFLKCSECGANLTLGMNKGKRFYGCQSGRDRGMKLPCQRRCLIRVEHAVDTVIHILVEKVFNELWVERVVNAFKEEVRRARQTVGEVIPSFEQALKRTEAQIISAERRLVHVPEDSMPVFLDELRRLKVERDEQKSRLADAREKTGEFVSVEVLECQLRERIASIPGGVRDVDVVKGREFLSRVVKEISVSPSKEAVLLASDGLLAMGGRPSISPESLGRFPHHESAMCVSTS